MRVTMVSTDYPPRIGGVAQHVLELGKALVALGHSVEVVTVAASADWRGLVQTPWLEMLEGLRTLRIPAVLNRAIPFLTGRISYWLSDRRFLKHLCRRLGHTRPQLVHWHAVNSRLNPMARWRGSARVWTNHTSMFLDKMAVPRLRPELLAEASQADEVIAPSEELRRLTVELGVPDHRVHFLSNGVDKERFIPAAETGAWRTRLRLGADERLLLCPRRLERKNGVRYFVEAAVRLVRQGVANARFVVAGDHEGDPRASEVEEVRALAGGSGIADRIVLLGRVENREMPGLYALSDAVVIPSLQEATSLSAMEAMASGKPVVATNTGGLPFLIRDGENGLLIPTRDAEALAAAVQRLLLDCGMAKRMGTAGRVRVEKELDWSCIARQTERVYEKALQRFDARPRIQV